MNYYCATLPSSAVGWWPGEGDASDRFARSPGTPQNYVSYTSGEVGQAFSFTASSQQAVEIPSSALVTSSFSVEAWVNPASQVGGFGQAWIFGQSFGRQLLVRNDGYNPNGLIVAWAVSNSRWPFYEVDSTNDIPIGGWSHLVGTWDGTTLRLYINGALNQYAALNITPWDSGCPFHIGGVYDPTGDCAYEGQFFNGLIDEVTYYNQALSPGQVSSLYNAGGGGKCFSYTLAYHMATNAVGHAVGHTFDWDGTQEAFHNPPVWNAGCWLHGVDGLGATSIGYSNYNETLVFGTPLVTMVSPRHCLFSAHEHPEGNQYTAFIAFLKPNNEVYLGKIVGRVNLGKDQDPSLTNDTAVGILEEPVPSEVGYVPVLDPNYSTYLPTDSSSHVQGIGMRSDPDAILRVFSQPISLHIPSTVWWDYTKAITPLGFGLGTDWSLPTVSQDSSCPQRLLINNQLVLVSAAWLGDGEGLGPNYATEIVAIQGAMNDLTRTNGGNYYTLQTYSLTGWPNIQ
jgi:hypothetical protein